jgi:hypothetical protein
MSLEGASGSPLQPRSDPKLAISKKKSISLYEKVQAKLISKWILLKDWVKLLDPFEREI